MTKDYVKLLYNGYVKLVLRIKEIAVDKVANTSTIEWELWLERNTTYVYNLYNTSVAGVEIEGETLLNKNVSYDLRNETYASFGKGQKVIQHDENGEKAITVWARLTDVAGLGDIGWYSGTFPLTKIDRESKIKKVTFSTLGEPVTVEIDRKVENYTHQVLYRVNGSEWFDLGKNISYAKEFIPPVELAGKITTSDTGLLDICVRTYDGNNTIGVDVYSLDNKIKVPTNLVPTFEKIEVRDANAGIANILPEFNYLQKSSVIDASIVNASSVYGATITAYKIMLRSSVIYGKRGDIIPDSAGVYDVVGEVTDSRGRKFTRTQQVTIHPYGNPTINVFLPLRAGNRTNRNVKAQTALTVPSVQISGRNINEYTIHVEYTPRGTEQWTTALRERTTQTFYTKTLDLGNMYDLETAFDFRLLVTDKFGNTAKASGVIGTAKVLAVFSKEGFSLGEMPEDNDKNLFNCALPAKFKNSVNFTGDLYHNGNEFQLHQFTENDGEPLIIPNLDLNQVKRTGVYKFDSGDHKNTPFQKVNNTCILQVYSSTNWAIKGVSITIQTIHSLGNSYFRQCVGNEWTEWYALYSRDELKWTKPNLESDWEHNKTYGDLAYSKEGNTVYLRGNIKGGSETYNATVFTLPKDYRPKRGIYVVALNNDYGPGVLYIQEDGAVKIRSGCTKAWLNFDNISFKI